MYNNNNNSKGKAKFLPPGFKDLGIQGKKQKLDVTISKQSFSKNDSVAIGESSKKNDDEDLWGADLPEDVVDECLTMASQVYSQEIQHDKPSTSKSTYNYTNTKKTNNNMSINQQAIANNISSINESVKIQNQQMFQNRSKREEQILTGPTSKTINSSKVFPRFNSDSNVSVTSNKKTWVQAPNPEEKAFEKIKKQFQQANQDLLTKQGEVTYLRNQIHNLQSDKQKEFENLTRNYKNENQKLKEELAKAQTLLEITSLEANTERCKLLEATSKSKILTTQDNLKRKSFSYSIEDLESLAKRARHSDNVPKSNKLIETEPILFESKYELNLNYTDGMKLKEMLMPDFFEKSEGDYPLVFMDVEKIKAKAIKGINRKELSRWPAFASNDFSIHSCSSYITELFLVKNLNDVRANIYIEKIFENCLKILVNQLILLNYAESEQTIDDLDNRDKSLMEFFNNEPKGVFRSLLDPKRWYKEERGIEARRALGLLSSLVRINQHAAQLCLTTKKSSTYIHKESSDVILAVKTPKLLFSSTHESQCSSKDNFQNITGNYFMNSNQDSLKPIKDKIEEIYHSCNYKFLNLIQKLVKSISSQRRSLQFTPFLCGVAQIIKYIPLFCDYNEESCNLLIDILKNISLARPRIEGIIFLLDCFSSLKCYPEIMNKFCLNTENSSFGDTSHGLIFLYQDSCIIQLISWMVTIPSACIISRCQIAGLLIKWLLGCFRADQPRVPHWLGSGIKDLCQCRSSIVESAIRLLYQIYRDYQINILDDNLKEDIRFTLAQGIQFLHILIVKDSDFCVHINKAESEYNHFLRGLKDIGSENLKLNKIQAQELKELIETEEDFSKKSTVSNSEVQVLYNNLSKDIINRFQDFKFDL